MSDDLDFLDEATTPIDLAQLRREHRQLDESIQLASQDVWVDQINLTRMKKRKLKLKDMISYLESKLIPDLNA